MRARLVDRKVTCNRPLGTADRLGSLIELRRHIEVVDGGLTAVDTIKDDERVNFEVGEVEVDVNGVEADEEVDEGLLLCGGDVLEERVRDHLAGGEGGVDGDLELEGLRVDITNVDTTFVGEEDVGALTSGVDADVVFGIRRVGKEGLDDEVVERAGYRLDLKQKRPVSMMSIRSYMYVASLGKETERGTTPSRVMYDACLAASRRARSLDASRHARAEGRI